MYMYTLEMQGTCLRVYIYVVGLILIDQNKSFKSQLSDIHVKRYR